MSKRGMERFVCVGAIWGWICGAVCSSIGAKETYYMTYRGKRDLLHDSVGPYAGSVTNSGTGF